MENKKNRLADTLRSSGAFSRGSAMKVKDTLVSKKSSLTRRTTVYLSEETWKSLKHAAVEEGVAVSPLVERLAKDYLSR